VIDHLLRTAFAVEDDGRTRLFHGAGPSGIEVWVYGSHKLVGVDAARLWIFKTAQALIRADFLASRRPPLQIKILIHNRVSRDIASTNGTRNYITVNIEEYQITGVAPDGKGGTRSITPFSVSQMLGLLAHELGVHSLNGTTLAEEELEAEQADAESSVTGQHVGRDFTVGLLPEGETDRQQADHLTIARAILGQASAVPRLRMYESTLISIIEAEEDPKDRKETGAAYCIGTARAIVANDNQQVTISTAFSLLYKLTRAAVAEWTRIQGRYGKPPHQASSSRMRQCGAGGKRFRRGRTGICPRQADGMPHWPS
jgi:hypothetical protein